MYDYTFCCKVRCTAKVLIFTNPYKHVSKRNIFPASLGYMHKSGSNSPTPIPTNALKNHSHSFFSSPLSHHLLPFVTPPPPLCHTTSPLSHHLFPFVTPPPLLCHTTSFPLSHHLLPFVTPPPPLCHTTSSPLSHHLLPFVTPPPLLCHTTFPLSHHLLPFVTPQCTHSNMQYI